MINHLLNKKSKKVTILELQKLTGFLNFLCKCIVPGRTFTKRLYTYIDPKMKQYHHVKINNEMRSDLQMWLEFLQNPIIYARPFMDFRKILLARTLSFYTDASKNPNLGCGGWCDNEYFYQQWDSEFIMQKDPSIEFLELYVLTAGIYLWLHKYQNSRIIIFCDNQSVCHMVSNMTSSCRHCMVLIRLLVLRQMIMNARVYIRFVTSKQNKLADDLSRLKLASFKKLFKGKSNKKTIPSEIWPMEKVWGSVTQ